MAAGSVRQAGRARGIAADLTNRHPALCLVRTSPGLQDDEGSEEGFYILVRGFCHPVLRSLPGGPATRIDSSKVGSISYPRPVNPPEMDQTFRKGFRLRKWIVSKKSNDTGATGNGRRCSVVFPVPNRAGCYPEGSCDFALQQSSFHPCCPEVIPDGLDFSGMVGMFRRFCAHDGFVKSRRRNRVVVAPWNVTRWDQ